MIDKFGLLRLNGCLRNAHISFDERFPIILPKDSHLTSLLVTKARSITLHGGPQPTLNHLSRLYWIIDGRTTVK